MALRFLCSGKTTYCFFDSPAEEEEEEPPELPPEAAELPWLDFSLEDEPAEAEPPPAAEPLTPSSDSVCWSSWPVALMPFDCWNSFSAFWVCGPILPSAWTFSFSWTCLMVSWSMLPLAPADADPEADLPLDDADLSLDDADLSLDDADLSLDEDDPLAAGELALPEDDPLAAGELELPDAPPEVAPCELEVDGWLADEPLLLLCVSCFCCATAPNDSNAAATATAIALIFMNISFPGEN